MPIPFSSEIHLLKMFRFSLILLISISSIIYESSSSSIINPSKAKQVSWKPRAFVYEGFLTDEECNHLISIAKTELKRSSVADNVSGKSKLSQVRTSSGMFISKAKAESQPAKAARIWHCAILGENGEAIQVLRYEHGQKYDPHYDYFLDKVNVARGGHRIATVLMYLSDVAKGGETVFPSAEEAPHHSSTSDDDLSECAKKGIAVKPRKGDALLFFSFHPTAIPDPLSLHGGCPVIEGEKWSATKWIHVDSFDMVVRHGGNCTDGNENCERWAALGECTKNPEYMVGTPELPGYCRRSCRISNPPQLLLGVTALRSQREACSFVSVKREEEEENQESKQSMEVGQLQRQYVEYTTSLFREGFLDSQFTQLQQLQDESNPDFVVEVVSLFFEDSERLLNDLNKALDQKGVDFKKVDGNVHQLKGSSSSIGANRVKNACVAFRNYCEEHNTEA
ncbi:hypothetical protein TEA_026613 [Camellia sinensis var. sinensis]|uniref:procollagen-proline 4-dioxygenase n=1 Tax=Camellia sinensis var. sinensis TaxID=542762 RepID=A0A4S4E6E4_CAMSN|nr:hypothetical protein TEA_026613 [Camellia sinensis var. sinensis]